MRNGVKAILGHARAKLEAGHTISEHDRKRWAGVLRTAERFAPDVASDAATLADELDPPAGGPDA